MRTILRVAATFTLLACFAEPAFPCQVETLPKPAELARLAEVIVRARAEGLSPEPGQNGPSALGASPTQVHFRILSVLTGTLPSDYITFNGRLAPRDEPNSGPVPYEAIRHSGDAACFATSYRQGGEYLLFLKRPLHRAFAQPEILTPYWQPLAPSNEQLFGAADPWEMWVREQLRSTGASKHLTSRRLVIRRFALGDAEAFAAYRSDEAVARYQDWENLRAQRLLKRSGFRLESELRESVWFKGA